MLTVFVGPLEADVDGALVQTCWRTVLLERLGQPLARSLLPRRSLRLVLRQLLDHREDLLVERHDDDEGSGSEGPASADGRPDVEPSQVEDVDGEHGTRPQDDEEEGEEDGSGVCRHLGCPELPDDNLERWPVVEVLAVLEVQLALVLGYPGGQRVVNVPGLVPLRFLNLGGHGPPRHVGHHDADEAPHGDGQDVSSQHGHLLAGVPDEGCCGESPGVLGGEGQPAAHAYGSSDHNSADDSSGGGTRPQDGDSDGDHGGGNHDAGEVVGPGQVEVDSPAEEAERDGEEGAEDDAPVLVVEQVLLVLLVGPVDGAGVVRLDHPLSVGPGQVVRPAVRALVGHGTVAQGGALVSLLDPQVLRTQDALAVLEVRIERADVSLVDVVDDDGRHCDDFRRAGRHDSHEDEEDHGVLSYGAEQLLRHKRSSQA